MTSDQKFDSVNRCVFMCGTYIPAKFRLNPIRNDGALGF